MQRQILRAYEDPEIGGIGLVLDEMREIPYASAAFSGLLIAHDILEHQRGPDEIGTIGDELVALGGVWYVRGRWGEISRRSIYSPHKHIASDVTHMAQMHYYGTPLRFVPKYESEHDLDSDFREIIECSRNEIEGELDDSEPVDWQVLDEYYHHALQGLRLGYDMAEKRYNGRCALLQFWAIEEAVEPLFDMCYNDLCVFELVYGDDQAFANAIN